MATASKPASGSSPAPTPQIPFSGYLTRPRFRPSHIAPLQASTERALYQCSTRVRGRANRSTSIATPTPPAAYSYPPTDIPSLAGADGLFAVAFTDSGSDTVKGPLPVSYGGLSEVNHPQEVPSNPSGPAERNQKSSAPLSVSIFLTCRACTRSCLASFVASRHSFSSEIGNRIDHDPRTSTGSRPITHRWGHYHFWEGHYLFGNDATRAGSRIS